MRNVEVGEEVGEHQNPETGMHCGALGLFWGADRQSLWTTYACVQAKNKGERQDTEQRYRAQSILPFMSKTYMFVRA